MTIRPNGVATALVMEGREAGRRLLDGNRWMAIAGWQWMQPAGMRPVGHSETGWHPGRTLGMADGRLTGSAGLLGGRDGGDAD